MKQKIYANSVWRRVVGTACDVCETRVTTNAAWLIHVVSNTSTDRLAVPYGRAESNSGDTDSKQPSTVSYSPHSIVIDVKSRYHYPLQRMRSSLVIRLVSRSFCLWAGVIKKLWMGFHEILAMEKQGLYLRWSGYVV